MSLYDESLEPRLQSALEELKPFPSRDARAAAHGRAQFLAQANSFRSVVSARSFWRHSSWDHFFPRKEPFRMVPIVTLILSLTLALGGSSAAVYASQDALPNDPLYAVKILSEDVRVSLTTDSEARADLMLALAARRASEIAATNGANADVLARQQAYIASVLQIAAGMSDDQMNQVLAHTRDVLDQELQAMDAAPALADARAVLSAERDFTQTGLDDQASFRARFQDTPDQGVQPPTDLPAPPFTSTLPVSGTLPLRPVPGGRGVPPFTSTIPISGTFPAPPRPDDRGTLPLTSTLPISGTFPIPPRPDGRGAPPFTSTLPITGTWQTSPSAGDRSTAMFTSTIPITGTVNPPPHPTEWRTPVTSSQPKSTPASGSAPQPKSTPVALPSQSSVQPQPPRGSGK